MGLKQNLDSIKGFEEAWKDVEHPVYTNKVNFIFIYLFNIKNSFYALRTMFHGAAVLINI
jgi:hypothetical protein